MDANVYAANLAIFYQKKIKELCLFLTLYFENYYYLIYTGAEGAEESGERRTIIRQKMHDNYAKDA